MAQREAGIRVTLKNAGFTSGLRTMVSQSKAAGKKMGRAMSQPMKAGLKGARGAMGNLMGDLKGHMKTAATLGGAFAIGKFASDAISLQSSYRNIAHNVNKIQESAMSWQQIQERIEPVADKTGQKIEDIAGAFDTVFQATGDLEYTEEAVKAIGVAATASGEDASKYAQAMQLAYRKFGVTVNETEDAIAAFDAKIGIGGAGIDDLNNKFAVMAGEAAGAGMQGVKGMNTLLGVMLKLDSSIGEKASPGLKAMFQYLKDNTTQLKKMEKDAKIKFEPDMTAFEKIRKLLESEKGRAAAELTFTADSRVVYDTLAQPFEEAYKVAIEQGKTAQEATELGMAAFDKSISEMSGSTGEFANLQKAANDRMKDDPTVLMRKSLNKMAEAFGKPKMMEAIEKLAKMLPEIAEGFVKIMDYVMDHPVLSGAMFVGGKMAIGFAQGAIMQAGGQFGGVVAGALKVAATPAGMQMGLAAKGALIGGAAAVGVAIGMAIAKVYLDNVKEKDEKAQATSLTAVQATHSGTMEEKKAALKKQMEDIRMLQEQQRGPSLEKAFDWGAKATGMLDEGEGSVDRRAEQIRLMQEEALELEKSITEMRNRTEAEEEAAEATKRMGENAAKAAAAMQQMANQGGVQAPSKLAVTPGHGAG